MLKENWILPHGRTPIKHTSQADPSVDPASGDHMIRFYGSYLASLSRPHIRRRHVDAAIDNEKRVCGGYHILRHTDSIQILQPGCTKKRIHTRAGAEFGEDAASGCFPAVSCTNQSKGAHNVSLSRSHPGEEKSQRGATIVKQLSKVCIYDSSLFACRSPRFLSLTTRQATKE